MGTPVRNGGDTHRRRGADLGAFEREGMPYLQQWRLGAGAVPIRTFRLRFAMNAREFHANRLDNYGLTPEHPHRPKSPLQS